MHHLSWCSFDIALTHDGHIFSRWLTYITDYRHHAFPWFYRLWYFTFAWMPPYQLLALSFTEHFRLYGFFSAYNKAQQRCAISLTRRRLALTKKLYMLSLKIGYTWWLLSANYRRRSRRGHFRPFRHYFSISLPRRAYQFRLDNYHGQPACRTKAKSIIDNYRRFHSKGLKVIYFRWWLFSIYIDSYAYFQMRHADDILL